MKKSELRKIIKEEIQKLKEGAKPSDNARKKIRSMVKIPAKQFHQTHDYIYYSKVTKDWWFVGNDGELWELRNKYYLKDIERYVKQNNIKL